MQPGPETHPHRSAGIVLLVVGLAVLVVGISVASYCTASFFGFCIVHPYAGWGILGSSGGFVMLLVGIILIVMPGPSPAPPPTPYPPAPALWPPPPPPPPPQVACTRCGRVYPVGLHAFCPNCGQKLG